ncbi:MAG: hypothetical protein HN348_25375 [Proteobacteria bacterium]|nr:hypothetical protein [Pseudomonadota bacterium]
MTALLFLSATLAGSTLGQLPIDRELSKEGASSESAQGLAFGDDHWYYANSSTIYRLNSEFRSTDRQMDISKLDLGARCEHAGGIDYFAREILVAVDSCTDEQARLVVLDNELNLMRWATTPALKGSMPWVAVDPTEAGYFYSVHPNKKSMLAFPLGFSPGSALMAAKEVAFDVHPMEVLSHFWSQGGAFDREGRFFRVVDDAHQDHSPHTGIWIYETDDEIARKTESIPISYDPDQWVPLLCGFKQCKRRGELEDVHVENGMGGVGIYVLFLNNEADEDDVSVMSFHR